MFTWEYTIMGNDWAWEIWEEYFMFCSGFLTDEEHARHEHRYPDSLPMKVLINRCFAGLVNLARSIKIRLAFQVLGDFLLEFKAPISNELKEEILQNSRWRDDRKLLIDKKDRLERRTYLYDFVEKILLYIEDGDFTLPYRSSSRVSIEAVENGADPETVLDNIRRKPLY